jgi:hypothetical protein
MRTLVLALAFLALPAMAVAQQADQTTDFKAPQVEIQQSTPSSPAAVDVVQAERTDRSQADVQSQTVVDDAAIQGGPTTQSWWWLVGAIVLAGILLAVLL